MNSITLHRLARKCLARTRVHFAGVYPAHSLPHVAEKEKPYCFIANTQTKSGAGAHWVVFYFDDIGGYFFDSYGHPPRLNGHGKGCWSDYLREKSPILWSYNTRQLQSYGTNICGLYCLAYLHLKSHHQYLSHAGVIRRLLTKYNSKHRLLSLLRRTPCGTELSVGEEEGFIDGLNTGMEF